MSQEILARELKDALPDLTQAQIRTAIEVMRGCITDSLKGPEHRFAWPGLGIFHAKASAPRTGRNPQTGEALQIPAGTRVTFTASAGLKEAVKVVAPRKAGRKQPAPRAAVAQARAGMR